MFSRLESQDVVAFARITSVRTEMGCNSRAVRRDSHAGRTCAVVGIACNLSSRAHGDEGPFAWTARETVNRIAGMTIVSGITNIQGSSEFSTTVYRRLIHLLLNVPPDFWAAFFYGSVLRQIDSTNHPHGFALRGTGGRRQGCLSQIVSESLVDHDGCNVDRPGSSPGRSDVRSKSLQYRLSSVASVLGHRHLRACRSMAEDATAWCRFADSCTARWHRLLVDEPPRLR